MNIGIPEFIFTALILVKLGAALRESEEEMENKTIYIVASILYCAAIIALLYWGGFYD